MLVSLCAETIKPVSEGDKISCAKVETVCPFFAKTFLIDLGPSTVLEHTTNIAGTRL